MKKFFAILMFASALTAFAACGNNNGAVDTPATNEEEQTVQATNPQDKSLEGTTWRYRMDEKDGSYTIYEIAFQTQSQCSYNIVGYEADGTVDNSLTDRYVGTYTYDGERGTLTMKKASGSGSTYEGTFLTESDRDEVIVEFREERIYLTKAE